MALIIDKEALKSGLNIFMRGDAEHRHFFCRIKLHKKMHRKSGNHPKSGRLAHMH